MATFIMLTRLEPTSARSPQLLERVERLVMGEVARHCPDVEWISSHATLGPYDFVDIFHAGSVDSAMRVSSLFRMNGHTHTEIWPATEWPHFKEIVRSITTPAPPATLGA